MAAPWMASIRSPTRHWNSVWPTAAGVWYLLVLAGLTFGAVNTGNNLVYVVLAALLAVLVVNNVLAEWNLRALIVRRALPAEVFAGEPAPGRLVLENPRRFGGAWRVAVEERDGGRARARFGCVGPGQSDEEPATWTFPDRGVVTFSRVRIASRFPFGLIVRWREIDVPGELLVYPKPERGNAADGGVGLGEAAEVRASREGVGELVGMRAYAPGDPVRRIHWPSSARSVTPLVILRSAEGGGEVIVRLGPEGEGAIRRACGEVLLHTRRGDAVGLEVGTERFAPRSGASQRRRLLTTLALLPPRGTPPGRA
ncbi:MAG: DUF58 domain-containing protein [Pseudomonadota bacterium]|nr:DUF58 domain-containing protein [Pseudomonadota bacterium]